jgi:spermidine synthase
MSEPRRDDPELPFGLVAGCFFASGLTGLTYELLWTRRLFLTFGSTNYSVTTVLAAFMAGLGLGSYLLGRRADRSRIGAVRLYAYLELGIGLYAVVSLPLLSLVERVYAALQSWLALGQAGATILKLVLAFPILAFPAALMGGTLPVLVRAFLRSRQQLHRPVSLLYGINTLGAAMGTALTGMALIELLGLWDSMLVAAATNLGIAAIVLGRLRRGRASEPAADPPAPAPVEPERRLLQHLRTPAVLFCAVAVVLTGLLSMLYEIVWTRLLTLLVGSSTYAFTIVLAVFLIGIAIGALLYARSSRSSAPTAFGLALLLLGLGLWVTISISFIPALPRVLINVAQIPGVTFNTMLLYQTALALFLLLVPTLLLGAALPMSMGIIGRALGQVGRDVGGVYLANTAGAIVGSVLTGFVLVPLIGAQRTLLAGVVANLLLVGWGVVAFGGALPRRVVALVATLAVTCAALAQPRWPAVVFDGGLGHRFDTLGASNALDLERKLLREPSKLLFLEEGMNSTISVRQFGNGVSLMVNGKADASSSGDMSTQVVLGAAVMLLHPQPKDVCIIGWGSGVTAHVATFFPELERLDVVEIERGVLRSTPLFHVVNGAVEQHPKVRVVYDDARSYLLTTRARYDVVISEPSNPWMAGIANLFSRDYYQRAKQRLKPGGVFGQWLQLYRIDSSSVAMILRTMLESFAHVQLWFSDPFDVILVGSDQPIHLEHQRVARAYQRDERLRQHMTVWGPGPQAEHFYGCFLLDRAGIQKIVERTKPELMTDDHPLLEYRATRYNTQVVQLHLEALWQAKMALGPVLPPTSGPRPSEGLALAGALGVLKRMPQLEERVSAWAMQRASSEPQVRLQRAKVLERVGKRAEARSLIAGLPKDHPGYRAEAALLEARILLHERRPQDALTKLEEMERFRPTARLWYQIQSALDLGRSDLAWRWFEQLFVAMRKTWDQDVRALKRDALYQRLHQLMMNSRDFSRGLQLCQHAVEPYDGEMQRLAMLVAAYEGLGRAQLAAVAMDELREFGLIDRGALESCERVFTAARQQGKARTCREQRIRLVPGPADEPIWK